MNKSIFPNCENEVPNKDYYPNAIVQISEFVKCEGTLIPLSIGTTIFHKWVCNKCKQQVK